jgi:ribosomal protein L1
VQYRTDKAGIIQCTIGRASFSVDSLQHRTCGLLDALQKAKPATSKGQYLKKFRCDQHHGRRGSRRSGQPGARSKRKDCLFVGA